jgi:hypothetical protein
MAAAKKPAKKAVKKSPAKAPVKRGAAVARKGDRRGVDMSGSWRVDADGVPLLQISFTASELIPTGDYANVTVGPVTVTKFIADPDDDDTLAEELNNLAEVVEAKCISEQREIVMESLQAGAE